MHEGDAAARRYAIAVLVATALTLVVVAASAFLRQAQAGLSCVDWPACYARAADAPVGGIAFARGAHRIAASGAVVAVIAMLAFGWRDPVRRRRAAVALAIVAALALLGIFTRGARLPAVALANLVGGFALLAALAAAHATGRSVSRGVRTAARVAMLLVLLQTLVGGSIGTQSALLACPTFPGCEGASWDALWQGGAWNPLREPTVADGRIVAPAGAAALHVVHRVGAVVLALLVLGIMARSWPPAVDLALTLPITVAAGVGIALVPSSLPLAVVHNVSAALLLAALARIAASGAATVSSRSGADEDVGDVAREARD